MADHSAPIPTGANGRDQYIRFAQGARGQLAGLQRRERAMENTGTIENRLIESFEKVEERLHEVEAALAALTSTLIAAANDSGDHRYERDGL